MAKKIQEDLDVVLVSGKKAKTGDPYKYIEEFFSRAFLDHYRKYISSMLKAAYSDDYWAQSDPGSLLRFQEQMLGLIKASHRFVKKGGNKVKRKKNALLDSESLGNDVDSSIFYGPNQKSTAWEYFPRSLSREEFLNPYKVYERFFEYKEIQTWVKEFKELISYALESFGNETGADFDYLEIHRQLQKLVEASHLIEIRVNMPKKGLALKTIISGAKKEESTTDPQAAEAVDNYSSDPYLIIDQFFLDGTIEDVREELYRFFEAAFPDELVLKKHYPTLLVYTYEGIDKLIDAAFTINQERSAGDNPDEKAWDSQVIPQIKRLYKNLKNWDSFPYKLKPNEWVNPRLAVKAFFEHQPLSHWKGKLHEFLQASIDDKSICDVISEKSKLHQDCEHLQRLVEAMWVIKVLEMS
jgi:hypothetical protein